MNKISIVKRFMPVLLIGVLLIGCGTHFAKPVLAADTIGAKTCDGIKLATSGGPDTSGDGKIDSTEQAAYDAITCKDDGNASFSDIITNVINILSILVGAVSVIMLIVGGFRYIISNGYSNSTKGAKDTIMYALIGLIIVLFAQVIVRFVWTNAS